MTDTPSSGVEAPSRFLMGLEDDPTANDAAMDEAIAKAFPGVEPTDVTVGNPNNVGEDGTEEGAEEIDEVPVDGSVTGVPVDETPAGTGSGGEVTDVATGDIDFAARFTERYGRKPNAAELDGLLQLADWANSLTPEQQDAINRALSGGGTVQEQVQSPSPAPEPTIEDPILKAAIEQYGEDDPIVLHLQRQQDELAELKGRYQQEFAQTARANAVQAIEAGSGTFKAQVEIEDVDIDRLQGAVTRAGIFPAFVQANGGDIAQATVKALEWAFWQDEVCRERELQKRLSNHSTVQQNHEGRKAKAASVTGTGGNGASRTDPPSKASADPWARVAEGLREAQNNGVPS